MGHLTSSQTGFFRWRLRFGVVLGMGLLLALTTFLGNVQTAHACGAAGVPYRACGAMFTHMTTPSNVVGNYTLIDNLASNGNPDAQVWVTANWNPGGISSGFDNHPIGVWYSPADAKWSIFNEDRTPMPINASFNITIQQIGFVHTTTLFNTFDALTYIDSPALNGNPSLILQVTQNYNPHAIGVWYDASVGAWAIYNEDHTPPSLGSIIQCRMGLPRVVEFYDPGSQCLQYLR